MQNGSEDFLVKTAIRRKDGNKSPTLSFTIQHKVEDETPVKNTASVPKIRRRSVIYLVDCIDFECTSYNSSI